LDGSWAGIGPPGRGRVVGTLAQHDRRARRVLRVLREINRRMDGRRSGRWTSASAPDEVTYARAMTQFDNVSVLTQANVYFDGKCVSHTVLFPDGTRKSVGVIFPSQLVFTTGAPETMEINAGRCRVRLAGSEDWQEYAAGSSFDVPGDSSFDIETLEMLDYACHFG